MLSALFKKNDSTETEAGGLALVSNIIRELNPKKFKHLEITANTSFDSLGFTSMMYVQFIVKLEKATKIEVEELAKKINFLAITTIGDLAQALQNIKRDTDKTQH